MAGRNTPTTSADVDNPDAATTAAVSGGQPADQRAEPANTTAAGDDGADKVISVVGMRDEFGPIKTGDQDADGKEITYTITRAGTTVAGKHVQLVRDTAEHNGVKLKSSKAS